MATLSKIPPLSIFFLLCITIRPSLAQVPSNETFTYVNQGEFGPYITENDATYRTLPIYTSPFQVCFYNITPNAFYLALRMATMRSESTRRWVWVANPFRPVAENATLTLGRNGNLILADADRHVVWSTTTANKGIVGLKILPTGNIVLYDNRDRYIWQSFDYPSDTLLVGQSLRVGGATKVVSKNGAYSLVLESNGLAMYMNNVTAKPLKYGMLSSSQQKLDTVQFHCEPENEDKYAYELRLSLGADIGTEILARPKYDATLSFLRIENDGNVVVYTYYDPVDYRAWEKTFAYFSDEIGRVSGCELPSKCGGFGLCRNEMCVACPKRQGLLGWSEDCATPALNNCKKVGGKGVAYYKVVGVENFLTDYGKAEGKMKVEECKRRCSLDCKCLGFMYWEAESKCWLAPAVGTLNSVSNSSHVAYIKYVN